MMVLRIFTYSLLMNALFSIVYSFCGKNHFPQTKLFRFSGGYTSSNTINETLKSVSKESSATQNKMKLIYFDGRGAAEIARLILKICNVDFIDERCTAKMENGKYITPEFDSLKAAGELHSNMNRLPVLITEEGFTLGQSKSIERYLATKFQMMGSTDAEYFQIDNVIENVRDIKEKYQNIRRIGGWNKPSEEREIALTKWFEEGEMQSWIEKLEKSLPYKSNENSITTDISPYAIGDKLSYADISIWHFLADYFDEKYRESVKLTYKNCPKISSIVNNLNQNNHVQNWLKVRPITPF